ncbi:uncharacterized protein [Dipodomys merriami]|uniref:uncharacterized protein isoform X2 n=1 Tax=Dipodomys merriami TaxID=94247 RepID=UPI003856020A
MGGQQPLGRGASSPSQARATAWAPAGSHRASLPTPGPLTPGPTMNSGYLDPLEPPAFPATSAPADSQRSGSSIHSAPSLHSRPEAPSRHSPQSIHSLKPEHEEFRESLPRKPQETAEEEAAMNRAMHRTKVPEKYTDSCKAFLFSLHGILKILRMVLVVGAVVCFIIGQAHQAFIAITVQEVFIVIFFILVYLVTLQHLLICLNWPLLDVMNSFISTIFLLVVAMMTIQEKGRRHLFYVGGAEQACSTQDGNGRSELHRRHCVRRPRSRLT